MRDEDLKDERGRRARRGRRAAPRAVVAGIGMVLVGCGTTVTATPLGTSTASSTGLSSAVQPNLVLDIEFTSGVPAPPDVALVTSLSAILGNVGELSALPPGGPDAYVGMLDGRHRVFVTLPDATTDQLDAARNALVGTRMFALRPVTSSTVDEKACAALRTAPKSDRLCDPDTSEVLTLGTDVGVVPTRVEPATDPASQSAATLTFSAADAKTIATYTSAHVRERLAVTDGLVLVTAPTIQSSITSGTLAISGNHSTPEAAAMVGRLQLAALGATITTGS